MLNVAIIIPIYKDKISANELISLKQCFSIFNKSPIIFVCPNKLKNSSFYNNHIKRANFTFLDDENFKSIATYNHMLLSEWFYKLFVDYDYILMHQLDSFVFRDELENWIKKDYSYVGAPWFTYDENHNLTTNFMGVGNGGFSLRKISHCIKVLKSTKKIHTLSTCIFEAKKKNNTLYWLSGLKRFFILHSFKTVRNDQSVNEDKIFALAAKRFQFFKIPKPHIALQFSFEAQPSLLYGLNNDELPFGCHAWEKYEPLFYKALIEPYGYIVDLQNSN
jgi:Protein of unknown function (DUF5672)